MKTIREIFGSVLLACVFFSLNVYADAQCHGKFAISMGGNSVAGAEQDENSTSSSSGSSFCACTDPPRLGMKMGFWEPSRLVDITRTPYCFVGLGGVSMNFNIDAPRHAQTGKSDGRSPSAFYQAHWYTNPLMFWMEVLLDDNGVIRWLRLHVLLIVLQQLLWVSVETNSFGATDVREACIRSTDGSVRKSVGSKRPH